MLGVAENETRQAPDRARALAHYREAAAGYDASCRRIAPKRLHALDLLELRGGESVIDVACGTGAMLEPLSRAVGRNGCVVGIEQSPEMLAIARARVRSLGLQNVLLVESPVEEASVSLQAEAMLFCYTHDVLRSPAALQRLFSLAAPGARVALCGAKLYPPWLGPLNAWVRWRVRRYLTTTEGLERPWSLLASYCPDFSIEATFFLGS
ncbi:MAG TPA: methyltransferase domain-containing protein, partial [Burkholderiales bacterium]|nr:methyltransferase domain-containing protein [Burkholderiales bacterium]